MLHAIIMAGGSGTRFWPASRASTPKQMLQLVGGQPMIRQTSDRLLGFIPPERQLVVTNARLVDDVRAVLPDLPDSQVIGEPCKRDTAPCIGLAALLVARDDPEATMLVMPADHVISPVEGFQAAVRQAVRLVDESPQRIVTFGIKPTYAAEIFGYIERGAACTGLETDSPMFRVVQFREKPAASTAEEYVASGRFYWNSGIFVWRASTILSALSVHQPAMLQHLEKIVSAWGTPSQVEVFRDEFAAIEPISIDYAVMEHAQDVTVVETPFDWDDLGGWQSLARLAGSDDRGNTIVGRHLGVRTENSIVRSSDEHLVVTLGLENMIVVHTPDATLVANKHDEEAIRQVVKELEARGWTEYL